MTFRVGQKVCCVDNEPLPGSTWVYSSEQPILGAVYTIDGIGTDVENVTVLFLVEMKRQGGLGYGATRFRPIVERKTDISAFHEILRKVSRKSKADA